MDKMTQDPQPPEHLLPPHAADWWDEWSEILKAWADDPISYELRALRGVGLEPTLTEGERGLWRHIVASLTMMRGGDPSSWAEIATRAIVTTRIDYALPYLADLLPDGDPVREILEKAHRAFLNADYERDDLDALDDADKFTEHIARELDD